MAVSNVSARRFWQAVAFGSFSGSFFRLFLFSVPSFLLLPTINEDSRRIDA